MTETRTVTEDVQIPAGTVFAVDREARVIRGLAVPFGVEGVKGGRRWSFSKGTVRPYGADLSSVKLWALHDKAQAVGVLFEATDTDQGQEVAFKVARTPEGDHALTMAEDGVWDGLSIGPSEGSKFRVSDGVYHSVDVPIHEISLTPAPVFGGARVRSVTFDIEQEQSMTSTSTEPVVEPTGIDFSALSDALEKGISEGFANLRTPQEGREVVSATESTFEVSEPSPYRFDGVKAEHSFVEDMRSAQQGDGEARQRLAEFGEAFEKFAVTTTNVGSLNPTKNRPDLYVPNLQFSRPLWESVSTGSLEDQTPFTVPKFSSASGLVSNHTQGVEPTPGAFAATVQTITPAPMSGKIEINREVLDQGGSPQADQIIWAEMLNAWYESIEAKIAVALNSVATAELNLGSVTDASLVNAITDYLASLQFVRGGNRYTGFVADNLLFPKLVSAADSQGRKLLPVLGPANAQGQTSGGFDRVQVGNQSIRAAWALSTALGTNVRSFNFVPSSVWAWASAPRKFVFEYQVKSVDMAIWGYAATAVLRDSDVKPIDYAVAD